MMNRIAATVLFGAALVTTLSAQAGKPAGSKGVMHEITISTTDDVFTGTIEMTVDAGKVTGHMLVTAPTEVTGTVAGTAKEGVLALEFPYHMTENQCDGTVKMNITLPATPGPSKGTMEAVGCGRDEGNKLTGTVELKPMAANPAAGRRGGGA